MNNMQCGHVVFGCCKGSLYDGVLELYRNNVHTVSRFTLLGSLQQRDISGDFHIEVVFSATQTSTSESG